MTPFLGKRLRADDMENGSMQSLLEEGLSLDLPNQGEIRQDL